MKNSSCFFENRECEYFPCHKGLEHFNCMFCYCPLYGRENCPGTPEYIAVGEQKIKSCENCTFPHQPENYEVMLQFLKR